MSLFDENIKLHDENLDFSADDNAVNLKNLYALLTHLIAIDTIWIDSNQEDYNYGFNSVEEDQKYGELIEPFRQAIINAETPQVVYCSDTSQNEPEFEKFYQRFQYQSILILPLRLNFNYRIRGHLVYQSVNQIMCFNSKQANAFSERDIHLLHIIINLFSGGLSMAMLAKVMSTYYVATFHKLPVGMLTLSQKNEVIIGNDLVYKILGVKKPEKKANPRPGQVLYHDIKELLPPVEEEGIYQDLENIRNGDEDIVKREFWYERPDKKKVLIRVLIYRYADQTDDGGQVGNFDIGIIIDDITDEFEKYNLQKELEIARKVQKSFLPAKHFVNEHVETYGISYPAKEVGGDYYDFIPTHQKKLVIAIGDVSGKGISAALVMASLQTSLRMLIEVEHSFDNFAIHLNNIIHNNTPHQIFITMFYGVLDFETRQLKYCNLGHNPPMLIRKTGEIESLERTGSVLGGFSEIEYELRTVTLNQDDILLCYTDGITEAQNAVREEFGEDRLYQTIKTITASDDSQLVEEIITAVKNFQGEAIQFDDMTLFTLKIK